MSHVLDLEDKVALLPTYLQTAHPRAWIWCLHCERAFQLGDTRVVGSRIACSFGDCDGGPIDFWRWESYRAYVQSAPEIPTEGRRYSLRAVRAPVLAGR